MTKTIKNLSAGRRLKPVVFVFLVVVIFLMAGWHIYSIGQNISSVVGIRDGMKKISLLERQKTEMDKQYISLISRLDLNYAIENGFEDQSKKVIYVSRFDALAQR